MFFDAIRNLFSLLPHVIQQGAEEKDKKRAKPKLLDMVEARFLSEEARQRNLELGSLIRKDRLALERQQTRRKVKQKVEKVIAAHYRLPEIVDEVTEKLTDAAHQDPKLRSWFG